MLSLPYAGTRPCGPKDFLLLRALASPSTSAVVCACMAQGPWIVAQLPTASGNTVLQPSWIALRRPADQLSADPQSYHMYWRWIYAYMAGHRTSTSLWLSDSYTCEFGFVCQWWLLLSSFQCGYLAFDLFFPFPKSNSASQYANDDWQRPTSIVDLTAREPCRIFTFAKHVSFEHSIGIPCPVISSRREGKHQQTDKTQKFLDTRSSISQSASTCLCSGAPRPVGDLAGAATFLSNRKYRYRPYTQPDVGNCWPWFSFKSWKYYD